MTSEKELFGAIAAAPTNSQRAFMVYSNNLNFLDEQDVQSQVDESNL